MTNRQEMPFSHPVKVAGVAANPVTVTVAADAEERRALARLWNVAAVGALGAELRLARWKRDGVRVSGRLTGEVTQTCGVTLEPVVNRLDEPVEALFVPQGSRLARVEPEDGELVLDPEAADPPETFAGDTIDVGAVIAEFAALGIDPYPRKPGVSFKGHTEDPGGDAAEESPFAALGALKGGRR